MTNSPTDAPSTAPIRVQLLGIPSLWQMAGSLLGAVALIVGLLSSAGAWYLSKSLEANQAKTNEAITKALTPFNERQTEFRMIVNSLVTASTLSPEQKQFYNGMLSQVTSKDLKDILSKRPAHAEKRSLNQLIKDKRVVPVGEAITGLVWDGNKPAQVRYMKLNDPSLDLNNIDLTSEGDTDPCSSKVLQSSEDGSSATVQICEAHLNSTGRLELIIIQNPNSKLGFKPSPKEVATNSSGRR